MFKRLLLSITAITLLHPGFVSAAEPREVTIGLPPASLAQWYKPVNDRQVWLHTMFRLRQALQAVEIYAERGERERLLRWAEELRVHYAELAEMVPEWRETIRPALAARVVTAAQAGDRGALEASVGRLQRKCAGCHERWKAIVTALHRSPDYAEVAVPGYRELRPTEYPEAMEWLADTLNRLKIAREDGELGTARRAARALGDRLAQLKRSCGECHREPASRERILGEATFTTLAALEQSLREPHDPKRSGRHLGTLGFTVCGRCHSIHRAMSDLRVRLFDLGDLAHRRQEAQGTD